MVAEEVAQANPVRVGGAVADGGEFGPGDQAGALAVLVADDQPPVRAAAMTDSATSTLMSSRTCGPAASTTSAGVLCTGPAFAGRGCV